MAAPLCGLVSALETCRGRDRLMRTLCYGCQLVGGAVAAARQGPAEPPLAQSLLAASAQLSQCRTVLRLFDGPAMLSHTRHYGLGPTEEDAVVRWLSVLGNVADQLYYPCEHVAWAADAGVLRARSRRWWALSTALWGLSLLLGILRSLRILSRLRRRMRARTGYDRSRLCPTVSLTPVLLSPEAALNTAFQFGARGSVIRQLSASPHRRG
ncbi:peroxisomal membrane protein 11C isoform X2 [Alligator mississippiensis]|uniref:peroxisomal membrane protein 11C isoform X2 n=1 Tax=Alligator mississippiensis TaxID=8496 RepID=UPI002877CAC1|nr:peroxisomal membrane protein 11C isoform X2 [Alligator mississippiensis]